MYPNFLRRYPFKTIARAAAVLSILAFVSCSKTSTNDISPQVSISAKQYSLEIAKALYSAIQLSNYNVKSTKKSLIDNLTEHKNDVIRSSANSLLSNEKFNKLFVSSSLPNARSSADGTETLDLEAIKKEINSPAIPVGVRKRLLQFSRN